MFDAFFFFGLVLLLLRYSEMLEAVGHEFMEDFFRRCDSLLAADGLLVLQVMTIVKHS